MNVLSFFSFFLLIDCAHSHVMDGHRMYFGGSLIGKASKLV